MSTHELEKALGLLDDEDLENRLPAVVVLPIPVKKDNVEPSDIDQNTIDDYEYARETQQHLIAQGNEALLGILALAADGPSPKIFEVAAMMIKTIGGATGDLTRLNSSMKDKSEAKSADKQVAQTINNTQIVASNDQILDLISNKTVISDG